MKKVLGFFLLFIFSFYFPGCAMLPTDGKFGGFWKNQEQDIDANLLDKVAEFIPKGIGKDVVISLADSKRAADALTAENEYYIGRAVAANIASIYRIDNKSPQLVMYLNTICRAITVNSPRPDIYNGYHAAILDTEEINAFATPGGHIFLTRGLINCAGSEDALAAVIAHEVAHIQLRHALTSIRNAGYADAAISGALAGIQSKKDIDINEIMNILGISVDEIIEKMIVNGFSGDQELEADTKALSLLASAGYEPSSLLGMLEVLRKNQKGKEGFGKTHPAPSVRIVAVRKELKKHKVPDTQSYRVVRFSEIPDLSL